MTIRAFLENMLFKHGMWPNEATEIVQKTFAENKEMKNRMEDMIDSYPKPLLAVLTLTTKLAAVKWIDENKPKHFARHILDATPNGAKPSENTILEAIGESIGAIK